MRQSVSNSNGTAVVKACFFTAVINSVFAPSYGQDYHLGQSPDYGPGPYSEQQAPADLDQNVLRYGPFDVRPRLRGGVFYDDNIFIQPRDEESDLIWNISPGVMVGAGDYRGKEADFLTLDYSPNIILFTDNSDENALDHDARLNLQLGEGRWVLGLEQTFMDLSGAVIDVGRRVDRKVYSTTLRYDYEISPKTSFDVNARQVINDYEKVNDFNEWTFGGGVDYAVTPKVKVGVGALFGFLDVKSSVNQSYQQLLLRASYDVTEKVTARGSMGGELRQFQGGDDDANFIFAMGGSYQVLPNTTLNLDAYRRVQNSVVAANQNYVTLGVTAGVRQVIRVKYSVHLVGAYENANYESTGTGGGTSRDDDFYLVRLGGDWQVLDRLAVGAYYQHRRNSSSLSGAARPEFTDNQVGLTASYQF